MKFKEGDQIKQKDDPRNIIYEVVELHYDKLKYYLESDNHVGNFLFMKFSDEDNWELISRIATEKESAFDKQVDGNHYKKLKIQPMEYALANNLNYGQSNAIKYITRYKDKNGIADLKKAIHCIELLIEFEEKNSESKD